MITRSLMVIMLLCITLMSSQTSAQQIKKGIAELSIGSDAIITGKVINQNSKWNDDRSSIYTDVTIEVEEFLKGDFIGNSIVVSHRGGEVGEVGELYTHMPKFETDEEILLFVKRDKNDEKFKVYDGENGKIQIIKDKITGEKITALNESINVIKKQIKSYLQEK